MSTRALTALVVHESMFHNTETIAEVVAAGLTAKRMDVTCVDVADAPPLESVDVDLLVIALLRRLLAEPSPHPRGGRTPRGIG